MKKICADVVKETLDGKKWTGEEETIWTVSISEEIKARVKSKTKRLGVPVIQLSHNATDPFVPPPPSPPCHKQSWTCRATKS